MLTAGADDFITREEMATFEEALSSAHVTFRARTRGAPHSFFDRHAANHEEAASDAWKQILEFIEEWR